MQTVVNVFSGVIIFFIANAVNDFIFGNKMYKIIFLCYNVGARKAGVLSPNGDKTKKDGFKPFSPSGLRSRHD